MSEYKKPPLTNFTQPVEQVTLASNIRRWLMNMGQNLATAYGPPLWDILSTRGDEEEMNTAIKGEINQIHDLRPFADPAKRTVFILASGASLRLYKEWLPEMKKHGYVITSPTVCSYLMHEVGVIPDLVVCVDANPASTKMVHQSGAHLAPECKLAVSLEAPPALPTLFGRERTYWFRTAMPGPDGSLDWEPYSVFQTFLAALVNVRVAQMGCVTNMAIGLSMALADYAGWEWDQIVLVGCDYGYWKGLSRVPLWPGEKFVKFDKACPSNIQSDGLWTDRRMVRYKASLLLMWMQAKMKIYTMSHGILHEFPRVRPRQIEQGKWPKYPSQEELHKRVAKWIRWFQSTDMVHKIKKETTDDEADVAGDLHGGDGVGADGADSGAVDGQGDRAGEGYSIRP